MERSDYQAEDYSAIHDGVALIDRSQVGRLSVAGEDALDLLNRLSTNELSDLETGKGVLTVLTSNKGRIVDLLFVLRQAGSLLVLTSPQTRGKVAEWIDFYTIIEDVTVDDVTEKTAMLSLVGPVAGSLLGDKAGQEVSALGLRESAGVNLGGVEATVIRTDFLGLRAYDVAVQADSSPGLWTDLVQAGARPTSTEAMEAVRVEQGVPAYGSELGEDYNPLEANLIAYVSFSKGCYVGQEVVARLKTYDKVQKRLVGLLWDFQSVLTPSARLMNEGKQVGVVTSVARSQHLGRGIGLGYVRKAYVEPGTELLAAFDEGELAVEVAELPLSPAVVPSPA